MKGYWWVMMLLVSFSAEAEPMLHDVDALRWQHRVIFVFGDQTDNERRQLQSREQAIAERDLLWFILGQDSVTSNYDGVIAPEFVQTTVQRFGAGSRVVLIGKDGGVKRRSDKLQLAELFRQIDAMPMRIQEMRAKTPKKR